MLEILRRVGSNTDHVIEIVEELDIAVRQCALDFSESRSNIIGERRRRKIDHQFFAEIQRGGFGKRQGRQRQPLVFFVQTPVNLAIVSLVVQREAGLHQSGQVAANRLRRDHVTVGDI